MQAQTQHPGEHLRRILEERALSQSDLAFILGQQATNINTIVQGRRGISPEMSKALGEALRLPHDFFADLQKVYDLAHANDPNPAVTLRANMQGKYPIRDMIKRGWIDEEPDAEKLQQQLVRFFEVSSADEIPYLVHAAKKTSYEIKGIQPAQLAWLFRVRQIAKTMAVPKYSQRALEDALSRMQTMLTAPEEARHVPRLLMECGVRFVVVESLPQSKIDGVCFWLDKNSPVIGMSTRYDRIDNFWFVLRHECQHVLSKDGFDGGIVDDLEGDRAGTADTLPQEERMANAAAADFCVPKNKLDSFILRKKPFYYEKDVIAFSKIHNVHPGIVVGQIQYRLNKYDYLKKYQVKIRQCVLPGAIADGWGQSVPI